MIPHFKGEPPNGTYQAEDPGLYHVVVLRLADHILCIAKLPIENGDIPASYECKLTHSV